MNHYGSILLKPIIFFTTIISISLQASACSSERNDKGFLTEELLLYLKDYDETTGKLTLMK